MAKFRDITAAHVEQAMAEYDALGRDVFLDTYGFKEARTYVLRHDGREYDSKAILGVARRYATGQAARADEFYGGKDGAARILADLGFEVVTTSREKDA